MNAEQKAEQQALAAQAAEMTVAEFLSQLDYLLEHSHGGLPHSWHCESQAYDGCTCPSKILGRVLGYGLHQLKDWPSRQT